MSVFVKSEVCQGCLSQNRRMSELGVLSPLLYSLLDKDTRLGQMAISNLVQTVPHLCWECLRMLQNMHKFQQRVYRAQSTLFLATVNNQWRQDFPVLSTLCIKKIHSEEDILNEINTEHHNNLQFEIPFVEGIKTETKIEEDKPFLDEDAKVPVNESQDFKLEGTDDSLQENTENFSDSENHDAKPKPIEAKSKKNKFKGTKAPVNECQDFKLKDTDDSIRENTEHFSDSDSHHTKQEPKSKKKKFNKGTKAKKKYQTEEFKTFKRYMTAIKIPQPETIPYTELKYTEKEFRTRLSKGRCYNKFFINKPFKCKTCVIGYENETELFEHMKVHDQEFGDFSCAMCKVYLKTQEERQAHIDKHSTCYKCNMCINKQYIALRFEHLRDHVEELHLNAYQCRKCADVVRTCHEFYVHFAKEHMKYTCDYCGHTSRYKRFLEKHIVRNHLGHKCEVCKLKFTRFGHLKYHSKVIHNIDIEGSKKATINQENMYCVECDRQFVTMTQYRSHLLNSVKHGMSKKRKDPKITCSDCGKLFSTRYNYLRHYRLTHEKVTKFHCEICNKYLSSSCALKHHSESVHQKRRPPRDKICTECGQAFTNTQILNNHMRTHTGERPFTCTLCPATFTQEAPLYTHVRRQHGTNYSRRDKTAVPKLVPVSDSTNAPND